MSASRLPGHAGADSLITPYGREKHFDFSDNVIIIISWFGFKKNTNSTKISPNIVIKKTERVLRKAKRRLIK
jgi:hypothetical protein